LAAVFRVDVRPLDFVFAVVPRPLFEAGRAGEAAGLRAGVRDLAAVLAEDLRPALLDLVEADVLLAIRPLLAALVALRPLPAVFLLPLRPAPPDSSDVEPFFVAARAM
jgi:hypothetical protein